MKKKLFITALSMAMAASMLLTGCGSDKSASSGAAASGKAAAGSAAAATGESGGTYRSVETFPYASIDVHKEYYAWHTQKYGLSESLFKINDKKEIVPWLAKSIDTKDTVSTIVLNDGICFSNGNPVTADMVKRNLERLSKDNKRYAYMAKWTIEAKDAKTLVITTPKVYPTIKNDLANAETGIMDLDATKDFDKAPICTGPFMVSEFVPKGDITLVRNDKYWGEKVKLDGVKYYAMSDDQSKLMAMQNGEVDGYDNISASDIELFGSEPDKYKLTTVSMEMRAYAFLNKNKIPDSVRQAIVLAIDKDSIAAYMKGMISPAEGAFDPATAYGKVSAPKTDVNKAKQVLEADGYKLNNGVYEKDGKPLTVTISCYAARSIDKIAVLMQEQLKAFGINAEIKLVEEPDGTYMTTKDYEIALYRMITDKAGDPIPFLDGVVKSGSYQDIAGFGNADTDAMIEELRYTADPAKRAEITNNIMQKFYDSNTMLFLSRYNRNTVTSLTVANVSATNPYEFYGVTAETTVK